MSSNGRAQYRCLLQADLLARRAGSAPLGDPNRELLASLIAGQRAGDGMLPPHLGLGGAGFARVAEQLFPGPLPPAPQRRAERIPEWDDLRTLLLAHRAGAHESEEWMARVVATACAGRDHLWQDLGLASRDELTRLLWINFPALARANGADMKWKKFLYRQYCRAEGIYVCPAPSCGDCLDYARCFGSES